MNDIHEQTKGHLIDISTDVKNSSKYTELIRLLILQALFRLMEEQIILYCRPQDEQLVREASQWAAEEYSRRVKAHLSQASSQQQQQHPRGQRLPAIAVNINLDMNHPLRGDSAGGIIASTLGGKIRCNNTLEARLEQAFEDQLPLIRTKLFGHSENRKFFD